MATSNLSIKKAYAVTPSDSVNLPNGTTKALLVGTAGVVKVTFSSGVTCVVTLSAGTWHQMSVLRVWAASLTAASVVAGY